MYITRVMTVGAQRLGNTVISLLFDRYITPVPDKTIILTCLPVDYVQKVLNHYFSNRSDIEVIHDSELEDLYPDIKVWTVPGDIRGAWLKQQALKMIALDHFDSDIFLIQDPDTFCIKTYRYFDGNKLYLLSMSDTSQYESYYVAIEKALGIPRQTTSCFVTEFMPVFKQDWVRCRQQIEAITKQPWLVGLLDQVPAEEFKFRQVKWFSEYELLGNWTMYNREVGFVEQVRFQFNSSVEQLKNINSNHNCICDKGPNGQTRGYPSIFPIEDNYTVRGLDQILKILITKI